MSGKSLKFPGPPITKLRLFKTFAKLNGNHLLMTNIFKFHEYQTFGLMKMHNMNKIGFANNELSLLKVWFTINGPSKMPFFNVCLFCFSKFQMNIVKNFMGNHYFL